MKKALLFLCVIAVAAAFKFATIPAADGRPPFGGDCFSTCMDHAESCASGGNPPTCGGNPTQINYCLCYLDEWDDAGWFGCTANITYAASACHVCCGDLMLSEKGLP
jgi:hypothetical protein